MARDRSSYNHDVLALIGKRIARVTYYELEYDKVNTPCYEWPPFPGHLLDFGLDLELSDGSIHGFIWDTEYHQYGIGNTNCRLSSRLARWTSWDATGLSQWSPFIDKTITHVDVYWSWIEYKGHERCDYPQDTVLRFPESKSLYLSAADYKHESDKLFEASDNIAVIFDAFSAKRYQIGEFANDA
ncbi:MAG: hypothetical protein AAF512_22785 [Pseudomonadota bacterium]